MTLFRKTGLIPVLKIRRCLERTYMAHVISRKFKMADNSGMKIDCLLIFYLSVGSWTK